MKYPNAPYGTRGINKLLAIQQEVANKISLRNRFTRVRLVGAADQAFCEGFVLSCIAVLSPEMDIVDHGYSFGQEDFPYIPGFLAFREGPAIVQAFKALRLKPDVLLIKGCGINHYRFAGLASHVGVLLDTATIGITKRKLCGTYAELTEQDESTVLIYNGRAVGVAFKTTPYGKPIFVSPGNGISMESSLRLVKKCLKGSKLPEPLRIAHKTVNELKQTICKRV